jgi:hypothetical protein
MHARLTDVEPPLQQIYVAPAQPEQLATAKRATEGDLHHPQRQVPPRGLVGLAERELSVSLEQCGDLVLVEDDRLGIVELRPVDILERVLTNPLPPLRRLEDKRCVARWLRTVFGESFAAT